MKKIILASIFATFALVGCGGGNKESAATDDPNKVYEVKFAHVVSANTPKGKAADFFAKRVNEMTDGRIVVHVFPSAQLVDDDKVFQELKRNNVQLAAPSFSKFTPFAKEFNLWDIPFIFRDTEHLHKVMDGEVGQILKDVITAKGYVALDYWDAGFKQFSTNKKPIVLPSDVEGQKMRIMSSKVLEEQTKAVKGIPQ
ncbi:DctP family TRAP transporter solute-binding subunit, partial [Helicobacter sp.]|uniref:DctP family TRAP transporter solute-binding subunit n=1 Tax=Helicobacter sp. TaxID=218 RepID=UPI002A90F7E1